MVLFFARPPRFADHPFRPSEIRRGPIVVVSERDRFVIIPVFSRGRGRDRDRDHSERTLRCPELREGGDRSVREAVRERGMYDEWWRSSG